MNDQEIIKSMLPDMAQIINAVPNQAFLYKDADTLLIMQRRLEESDLKKWLTNYNYIFSKQDKVSVEDITLSSISFVRMKVLLEVGLTSFDAKSLRDLIKECRLYMDKTTNIIRLSNTHVMTADSFQKERIAEAIAKNEAFIKALEETIEEVEKQIERIPKPLQAESNEQLLDEEMTIDEPNKFEASQEITKLSLVERASRLFEERRNKQGIDERLKNVEKENSDTKCLEIPFYDKSLVATEVLPCRDFDCFVLLKRKENLYFGRRCNMRGNCYDNSDQSLIELTEISEEFIQFMTVDVMSDEFELRAFSKSEKEGMQMYFNFVSKCFEKQIGITLTVAEYLNFQAYYNRLVSKVLELEEEKHHDYYRALPIADKYMTLMDSYNMVQSENRGQIIEAIKAGNIELYLENMELIMSHHIVDEKAKAEINDLMDRMKYFFDEGHWISERENKECSEKSQAIEVMPPDMSVIPMGCIPQMSMFQAGVMPIVGNMYFTLQCLNENHEIVDEANFSTGNMSLAMKDYNSRKAYIKRFGLVQDGKFLPLLTSEKGED